MASLVELAESLQHPQPPPQTQAPPQERERVDPFPLASDVCGYPGCAVPESERTVRIPCLKSFGRVAYCCQRCMDLDYPDHHFEAMQIFREVTRGEKTQVQLRQKQLASQGYKRLIQNIIEHVDRTSLLNNIFLIRLPDDAAAKIRKDHPVKRVPRQGCAPKMLKSAMFTEAWKKWTKHLVRNRGDDAPPFLYFWAYPPDLSFVFLTSVPYEEQEKFDESLPPESEFVPYPELG